MQRSSKKLKTFWLNVGFLDRDISLSGRKQILKALVREGVDTRANFNYIRNFSKIEGLDKVFFLRLFPQNKLGVILLSLKQQFVMSRNLGVDVIILRDRSFHETLPLWFFWRKVLRRKTPKFILDLRSYLIEGSNNWSDKFRQKRFDSSLRIALKHFDGVTVITDKMRRDIQRKYDADRKNIFVWNTGVDTTLFDPDEVVDLREKLGLEDHFVVLYHGVFSPNRGLKEAIEATKIVSCYYSKICLFLLGKGPAQSELKELVVKLNLEGNVQFHHLVPFEEVPKYIKTADIGILPFPNLDCWNTSGPLKLNEYLAMGRPVLLTDIESLRETIGSAPFGFFVRNNQPSQLAEGILNALKRREELPNLGRMARAFATSHLTWKSRASAINQYFQSLCKAKSQLLQN